MIQAVIKVRITYSILHNQLPAVRLYLLHISGEKIYERICYLFLISKHRVESSFLTREESTASEDKGALAQG